MMIVSQAKLRKAAIAVSILAASLSAQATSFVELYRAALLSDPQYAAAKADRDAADSLVTQSRGQFFPQISASSSRIKNNQNVTSHSGSSVSSKDYDFTARAASLSLSQALFRPQIWASYAQTLAQVQQAEGSLRQSHQDLILKLALAYFEILLSEDNVTLAGEQKAAIAEQLKQATRYFEAGVGTITDINEAQARYDTVVAQEIAAQNSVEVKIRALEQIVGAVHRQLDHLGSRLVLEMPQPANIDEWLEFSRANNPAIKAREAALEVAQKEVYKSVAAHLPTVDLVASRVQNEDPSFTMIGANTWNSTVGIQISLPLFSGGTTQGRVNQASAQKERARYELDAQTRAVTQSTRTEFLNVVNGVAQVNALTQAVKSNEVALYSARKGLEAGTRTSFDVLNAQQLLFTAKRDLAQARYQYVLARLKLRGAAGLLDENDIELVQRWLDK